MSDGKTTNDVLTWNGTVWESKASAGGGLSGPVDSFLYGIALFNDDEGKSLISSWITIDQDNGNWINDGDSLMVFNNNSFGIGPNALSSIDTASDNVAVGRYALSSLAVGQYNTAAGI